MENRGWVSLSVELPPRGEELALAEALRRLGGRGIQREGGRVVAYLPPGADRPSLAREAEAAIRAATSLREPGVSVRRLAPGEDRALWGGSGGPARVSSRIGVDEVIPGEGVAGEGDDGTAGASEVGEGRITVRIRPGPAFGSAAHPTTRSCLRLLDRLLAPGDRVLDVGAGTGILAIAAVLLGARHAVALEADEVACRAARENVAANGVEGRVALREGVADAAVLRSLGRTVGPFDGVLANIETGALLRMLPALAETLAPEGWLVLAGVPGGEAAVVRDAAERAGLGAGIEEPEDGWWSAAFLRR
jgi:precorrin-6B methylase 2